MQVELELEKETKGAVRYAEKGDESKHILGTMYIRKTAFKEEQYPNDIQVTIESQL
jgi:hypothetical protein